MTIRVVQGGQLTTVQDLGRRSHQHEGVPEGGAMDTLAARLVNLLVGNAEDAAVLEATLAGPSIVFERETLIALGGGDFAARLDGTPLAPWRSARAAAGSTLALGGATSGSRGYIAVDGGIDVATVLGSRSTYLPGKFGGHEGRALRAGDVLALGSGSTSTHRRASTRFLAAGLIPDYSRTLRVLPGRDPDRLNAPARDRFWDMEFVVSPSSDRMGYRLAGPALAIVTSAEVLSAGVTMGTIQVPPGGAPILLMADRQTTGGYPVLGQVATVDLGAAAQLKAGDAIRFAPISLDDAQRLYLDRERAVGAIRLAPAIHRDADAER